MRPLLLFGFAMVLGVGCGAPLQGGETMLAPGTSARFAIAMRYGYGARLDIPRPADVRRAVFPEQLVGGSGASGRVGDWVIENGFVTAIVANVDGTARGGRLVDVARRKGRIDELAQLEVSVLGGPVRYDSLKTGIDDVTGAVWINVVGHAERRPDIEVSTRYDLSADLAAVVVHTSVKGLVRAPAAGEGANEDRSPPFVADTLTGIESEATVETTPHHVTWFGRRTGYLLRPLSTEVPVVSNRAARGVRIGPGPDEETSLEPFLWSRMIVPLERPDTAALAVALARIEGRAIGDVEVRPADPRALTPIGGAELSFARSDGTVLRASGLRLGGAPAAYVVALPTGSYTARSSDASEKKGPVVVEKGRLTIVELRR